MDDEQGRKRLFAISTNHPLSSQPDSKPALTSDLVPFEDGRCFPAGNLSVTVVAVAEDSRRSSAKFSRLSKSFLCCLPASALSWRLPQISILICASRGQEAQNNKPNHGDYRVASSCQSFFSSSSPRLLLAALLPWQSRP